MCITSGRQIFPCDALYIRRSEFLSGITARPCLQLSGSVGPRCPPAQRHARRSEAMDHRSMPRHSTEADGAFSDNAVDEGGGSESLVPCWLDTPSLCGAVQADPEARGPPLRGPSLGSFSRHEGDSSHFAPLSFNQMTPAFSTVQDVSPKRSRRVSGGRRQRLRDSERHLRVQLEKLKQEQEVLAAEKLRLQQVTSHLEREVRRRNQADQQLLTPTPSAYTDGDSDTFS